jgi:hypothetical protein
VVRKSFKENAIEVVSLRVCHWRVLGLYKSPRIDCPLSDLTALLQQQLALCEAGEQQIIFGDFNVDLNRMPLTKDSKDLKAWMEDRNFDYVSLGPTTDSLSTIDLLWTNSVLGEHTIALDAFYSDHKLLFVTLPKNVN